MFDLVSMAEVTATAALVVTTLASAFGTSARESVGIVIALAIWFVGVLWLGASQALNPFTGLGVGGLGVAVAVPVAVLTALVLGTEAGRARLAGVPLTLLVGIQTVRVIGISFVLLYAAGRLPAPFAPVAGWGDVLVGVLAPLVAFAVARAPTAAQPLVGAWTLLGIADLVTAVGLGVLSSPGPIHLLTAQPGTELMTSLPMILVPAFMVPLLFSVHLVTLRKLRALAQGDEPAADGVRRVVAA